MVLDYAKGGNLYHWISKYYNNINWSCKINILLRIINGLKEIHQKNLVHHDFHTGNILSTTTSLDDGFSLCISDMGLCGEIDNMDETNVYGVMPFVAPEVLRGYPYTQAADIYSFGMIMYFVATGRQPFSNYTYHDQNLVLDICNGIRPEINEQEVPACYIDLMERCWDSNPNNRPNAIKIRNTFDLFYKSYNDNNRGQYSDNEKEEQCNYDDDDEQYRHDKEQNNDNEKKMQYSDDEKEMQYSDDEKEMQYSDDEEEMQYSDDEKEMQYGDEEEEMQYSDDEKEMQLNDIEMQFKKADEYKESKLYSLKEKTHSITHITHTQAIYKSRLLSSFTKDCLECAIDD
jgi:serine/threonine protein kinase